MTKRIGKSLVAGGATLVTQAEWNEELNAKHEKLVEFLRAQRLSGILIRRNENVAWITGGAVQLRVLTPCETGVASLLVTAEGKRYYFTTENEAPRLHDEEFGALDFEPVLFPGMRTIRLRQQRVLPADRSAPMRLAPVLLP